jgi:hypothetical protein
MLLLCISGAALAAPRFFDDRYHHGHFYPPRGAVVHELPLGYRPYYYHGSPFFFVDGVWYKRTPGGFAVVTPPVGLVVDVLPPFPTTIWIGGMPYFYADDVYYQWDPASNGYRVVDPPAGASQPTAAPNVSSDNLFIYPRNGQTASQQAADRYECHNWAKSQSGFDPTQPATTVSTNDVAPKRDRYRRAMTACLEGRGYSID